MKITYYKKNVYGVEQMYISDPEIAKSVYRLTGKKTVNNSDFVALAELGHQITHEPIN